MPGKVAEGTVIIALNCTAPPPMFIGALGFRVHVAPRIALTLQLSATFPVYPNAGVMLRVATLELPGITASAALVTAREKEPTLNGTVNVRTFAPDDPVMLI